VFSQDCSVRTWVTKMVQEIGYTPWEAGGRSFCFLFAPYPRRDKPGNRHGSMGTFLLLPVSQGDGYFDSLGSISPELKTETLILLWQNAIRFFYFYYIVTVRRVRGHFSSAVSARRDRPVDRSDRSTCPGDRSDGYGLYYH